MNIAENGIYLNLGLKKGEAVRLLHFSSHPQEMEIGDDDVSAAPPTCSPTLWRSFRPAVSIRMTTMV